MDDIESMQSDKYDTWGYVSSRLRFGKGLGAAAETILTLAAGRFLPEKPILTLVEDRPGDVHGIVHLPSRRLPLKTGPKPKEAASVTMIPGRRRRRPLPRLRAISRTHRPSARVPKVKGIARKLGGRAEAR